MSELPKGWADARGEEVFSLVRGVSYKKNEVRHTADQGYVGVLRATNLQRGEANKEELVFAPAANVSDDQFLRAGDILIATSSGSKTVVGKSAKIEADFGSYSFGAFCSVARAENEDLGRFLSYYFSGDAYRKYVENVALGININNFRTSDLKALPIPLPPLPEQRRIVRKLDTLSARTTTARTHLTAIAKLVERYKVGVLGQLFGKSGADPKPTEHLWAIPPHWSWKKVKDVGDVGLGRQRSPQNHDGPFMRPYIRSANITWHGVDTSDVKEMNFDEADFERFQLVPGDVLLNEGSGSAKEVGKPAIWRGEVPNCCYQNTVLRVQPRECSSEYLYWYFLLTALSEGFVGDTKGVNIQHIGKNGLANFPIPVPPIDEQNEIVRRIEAAFAKIDRLAAEAEKALKLTDRLDGRILAKAFAGELVPQNPTDEPATELLARIRKARATAPKPKRGRRQKVAT